MSTRLMKLKDCCIIKPPKSEAKELLSEDDMVSFVPMKNLGINTQVLVLDQNKRLSEATSSYTYFANNDVLLAKITPCFENGKLGIAKGLTNGVGFGSSEFIVFRPSKDLLPEYLYYYLLQPKFREQGQVVMTGAVGHKRVPKDYIENSEILVPSIEEQKKVITILKQALSDMDKVQSNAKQNLANVRELFNSYQHQVFTKQQVGWVTTPLFELCDNYKKDIVDGPFGANLKREHYKSEGIPVLKIQNIKPFKITLKKMDYVTQDKFDELERHSYKNGDIVMTKLGDPLGESAIVEGMEQGLIVADLVRVRAQKINTKLLCYHLNSPVTQQFINSQQKGATRPRVKISVARELPIYHPKTKADQKIVVDRLDSLFIQTNKLSDIYQRKITSIDELKSSILQKAFTGELTKSKGVAA